MIPLCEPYLCGNEWKYIKDCLDSNWVSSVGSYVDLFEKKFSKFVDVKQSIVTVNGTSALHLALEILGVGPGDEVIVPSLTFVASVNSILYVGANPVFVDVSSDTWVMDVNKVEEVITDKTVAVMPVHLYGNVVDMEPLIHIAKKYNLYIIEDATEALGAKYKTSNGKWKNVGTLGDIGVFSFNGNKLITTGSGGMLVSDNIEIGEKAKYLSNQAKTIIDNGGFYHEEIGYNFRMPNILAAMGVAQLDNIGSYIHKKLENTAYYNELLKHCENLQGVCVKDNVNHVQWLYSILVKPDYKVTRDELIKQFKLENILSRPFFLPIHEMKPYLRFCKGDLSITKRISEQGINLPSSITLTREQIERVCEVLIRFDK